MASKASTYQSLRKFRRAWANPGFDPRIMSVGGLTGPGGLSSARPDNVQTKKDSELTRGYIVTADTGRSFDFKSRYRVDFLYNPSTVEFQNSVDMSSGAIEWVGNKDDASHKLSGLQGSCGFNLLFDRTYEVFDPQSKSKWSAAKRGVMVDVDALYALVGINQKVPPDEVSDPDADPEDEKKEETDSEAAHKEALEEAEEQAETDKAAAKQAQGGDYTINDDYRSRSGIMVMMPVRVFFGQPDEHFLTFYGYINSLGVSYTHWTQKMVPTRATVSISMTKLPESVTGTITDEDE